MCAISLDYFTDPPKSIGCFCRGCVTQLWGKEDEEDGRRKVNGRRTTATRWWGPLVDGTTLFERHCTRGMLTSCSTTEDDEPWVGDGGIRNWDNMAHVWDPEEEEDRDYYLGGLRRGLRRLP